MSGDLAILGIAALCLFVASAAGRICLRRHQCRGGITQDASEEHFF